MTLRGQLKRIEQRLRGTLESFVLEDSSRFYSDPTSGERFLHSMSCVRAQGEGKTIFPEPPETIKALTKARDRGAVLRQFYPDGSFGAFPYEIEPLLERGELVPRSMVAGRELGEPLEDLSE